MEKQQDTIQASAPPGQGPPYMQQPPGQGPPYMQQPQMMQPQQPYQQPPGQGPPYMQQPQMMQPQQPYQQQSNQGAYPGQHGPLAHGEVPTMQPYTGGNIVCPFCHQSVQPINRTFVNYDAKTNQAGFCLGAACCFPCLICPFRSGSTVQKTVMQCPSCKTFIQ
ncbi:hypothetical protein BDV3_000715 [Batrachochytrium dendrobatidis]|uniref:LITAF domain-containing protein n=1 Tax=Batrachochytrium dendrobatidis (strain JEL423) TaxID=403673 RepID=A0A177W7M9_BATDL|nr:hypothetical protein BDEG_20276 [Batrachochytrium dendrobatidis JEL423]